MFTSNDDHDDDDDDVLMYAPATDCLCQRQQQTRTLAERRSPPDPGIFLKDFSTLKTTHRA